MFSVSLSSRSANDFRVTVITCKNKKIKLQIFLPLKERYIGSRIKERTQTLMFSLYFLKSS